MTRTEPSQADAAPGIELLPHDPGWLIEARVEGQRIATALQYVCSEVFHLGSTSIPGISAKPVLDLFPIVTSLPELDERRGAIEALGYEWRGEYGLVGRRYCVGRVAIDTPTPAGTTRRVHMHCYERGASGFERHRIFRDYLRAHPEEACAYESVKQAAAQAHPYDGLAYNAYKSDWIQACEQRASAWMGARAVPA